MKSNEFMTRKEQREKILQLLYAWEYNRDDLKEIDQLKYPFNSKKLTAFMQRMIDGIIINEAFLDEKINLYAINWNADKMFMLDKLILRLAIFEMFFIKETPKKVIINEAIELAKKYSAENSKTIINGILNQIFYSEMGGKNEEN